MSYIGNSASQQSYTAAITYFQGNGSTVAFTLPYPVATTAGIIVHVENVPQNPAYAFTVSGNTLTFTSAPPANATLPNNIWVEYTSPITQVIAPSPGTVGNNAFGSLTAIPFASGQSLGAGNASIMKNRIINGAMVIDQRNAGASGTAAGYTLDRWTFGLSQASKLTWGQNLGSVTPPAGFTKYLGVTSSSAYSVGASDYFFFQQFVEGYNMADLAWGTASAKTVTLSFQIYSSLTGTFGGALQNGNASPTYSYPFTYSIPVANTWTTISVTVAGPTAGTWTNLTNGQGLTLNFGLGVGSTYSGTAGSWATQNVVSATGATSVVGTSGATFYITGIQLEVGSSATGFEYRQYQQELALCQRYYSSSYAAGVVPGTNFGSPDGASIYQIGWGAAATSAIAGGHANLPVTMRVNPSVFVYDQVGTLGVYTGLSSGASQTNGQSFNSVVGCANSVRFRTYSTGFYGFAVSWVAVAEL